jgi:hypothetical protein
MRLSIDTLSCQPVRSILFVCARLSPFAPLCFQSGPTAHSLTFITSLDSLINGLETKYCGLVAGYATKLTLRRSAQDKFSAEVDFDMSFSALDFKGGPNPCVAFGVNAHWSQDRYGCEEEERTTFSATFHDLFGKTKWAQAVREGSPFFPGGMFDVRLVVRMLTNEE